MIEVKAEDIIWKIEEYLTLIPKSDNQLHGQQDYFYPVEPELFQLPSVKPQQLQWLL
ncbi:MAG: hypothetical protein WAM14_21735 [Candidatus Nitrosopolaris sp.]